MRARGIPREQEGYHARSMTEKSMIECQQEGQQETARSVRFCLPPPTSSVAARRATLGGKGGKCREGRGAGREGRGGVRWEGRGVARRGEGCKES